MLESLSMDGHLQAAVRHLRTLRDEIDAMLGRLGAFTQQAPFAAPPKQPLPPAEILNERVLEIMLTEGVISTPRILEVMSKEHIGPVISLWKYRAEEAGFSFDDLFSKRRSGDGSTIWSLTALGRTAMTKSRSASMASVDSAAGAEWTVPDDVFDLADCMGWDIQHYRKHRLERSHLVALLLHVHRGASESEGGYTPAQANAVLQRLIRSAPTILDAVGEVLEGGQIPEGDSGHEDTTESRRQSAAAGVRAARSRYSEDYRNIPWPQ